MTYPLNLLRSSRSTASHFSTVHLFSDRDEPLFSFFKVDDIPDCVEVL